MTTWPDVLTVAINVAGLCFILWLIMRPRKP